MDSRAGALAVAGNESAEIDRDVAAPGEAGVTVTAETIVIDKELAE